MNSPDKYKLLVSNESDLKLFPMVEREMEKTNIYSKYNSIIRQLEHESQKQIELDQIDIKKMLDTKILIELRDFFFKVGFRFKFEDFASNSIIDQQLADNIRQFNEYMRFYFRDNKYVFAKKPNKVIYLLQSMVGKNGKAFYRPVIKEVENNESWKEKLKNIKANIKNWFNYKECLERIKELEENSMFLDCNDHLPLFAIKNRLNHILVEAVLAKNKTIIGDNYESEKENYEVLTRMIESKYDQINFKRAKEICWWCS